jgi:hypothetical protein
MTVAEAAVGVFCEGALAEVLLHTLAVRAQQGRAFRAAPASVLPGYLQHLLVRDNPWGQAGSLARRPTR